MIKNDDHNHCEGCGIRIPLLPEDASFEENLCDQCLNRLEADNDRQDRVSSFRRFF